MALSRAPQQENVSTALATGITDASSSVDVNDASKFNYPSYLMIDRVDSAGTLKNTSLWELVKVTNISSNTLTITRGQGGTTAQSHSSGAIIEAVVSAAQFEEWYNALNPEHTATGGHVISTATVAYLENIRTAITSIASVKTMYVTTNINVSGASIVGFSTAGGFNAVFQVPGGLSSVVNIGGLIPVSGPFTGSFMQAYVRTPASIASVGIMLQKNFADYGYIAIPGGATFASSASIGTPALTAGDVLTMDIRSTASLAQNLSVVLRAT